MEKDVIVALAGNPNAGKTTIFNALTGSQQHVGNWPGKTVEHRSGLLVHDGLVIEVVDLPGTYSLSAYSPEELIARDFIVHECPDLTIVVVDAGNLERNLYLVTQILELPTNVLVALNMMDMLDDMDIEIDIEALEAQLGVPVVPMVAREGEGIDELLAAMTEILYQVREEHVGQRPAVTAK
jgi:ferrous iron transport protein B